jgi:large subunit ribosomal protein L30
MSARLRITQTKSASGHPEDQKRTVRALGIRRMQQTVEHSDTPQIRGMVFKVADLLAQHVLGFIAEQIPCTRTHEGVTFVEIDHQDEIGETFEQPPPEFFLLCQFPFHVALFCDIDQRALIADDLSLHVPHCP